MNALVRHQRWIAATLAGVMVLGTVSPAWAGSGKRRYKGARVVETRIVRHAWRPPVQHIVVRESNAAPVVAGILGGLILGAAIAHAGAPPADHYYYWDPYCERRFASLEMYRGHFGRHHHPRIVRVIEVDSGRCAYTYRWHDGAWHRWDDGRWDDGYDRHDGDDDGCDGRCNHRHGGGYGGDWHD
uniref:Uncharacterized protein n=1 Tax=Eiseniibacteriota bacterium TaxID=2212470 RepID=A0A832MJ95_UNCEI